MKPSSYTGLSSRPAARSVRIQRSYSDSSLSGIEFIVTRSRFLKASRMRLSIAFSRSKSVMRRNRAWSTSLIAYRSQASRPTEPRRRWVAPADEVETMGGTVEVVVMTCEGVLIVPLVVASITPAEVIEEAESPDLGEE